MQNVTICIARCLSSLFSSSTRRDHTYGAVTMPVRCDSRTRPRDRTTIVRLVVVLVTVEWDVVRYASRCTSCVTVSASSCRIRCCSKVNKTSRHCRPIHVCVSLWTCWLVDDVAVYRYNLPCDCPRRHEPVCALSGRTYHNSCLALSVSLTSYHKIRSI